MESISEVEPTGVADGSGGVRERSIMKASGLSSGENGVTCPLAEGRGGMAPGMDAGTPVSRMSCLSPKSPLGLQAEMSATQTV